MSYCRWSSDDFQCDVYVYEDVRGGWTTHVAGNRVRYAEPLPAPVAFPPPGHTDDEFLAWYKRHQAVLDMVGQAERLPIGLPHDGKTFNDPTPGECADRLAALAALGYRVPVDVIDCLRAEQDDVGA
jgi:hypothetical protein